MRKNYIKIIIFNIYVELMKLAEDHLQDQLLLQQ